MLWALAVRGMQHRREQWVAIPAAFIHFPPQEFHSNDSEEVILDKKAQPNPARTMWSNGGHVT